MFTDPTGSDVVKMYYGRLKRLCFSRDGVHLWPERTVANKTVYQNGSIDTKFHPPDFIKYHLNTWNKMLYNYIAFQEY
jgi:hypothetical protein